MDCVIVFQMTRWLERKAGNCSGRCQLFSIGKSFEGRDLKVMKVGRVSCCIYVKFSASEEIVPGN